MALIAAYDPDSEEPTTLTTAAELDDVLDRVAAWGHRALIEFRLAEPADKNARQLALSAGLHGASDRGTLIYSSPAGVWFSKASPGPEWEPAERILYYYMSADTEYPPDSEIPLDLVRRAVHDYMTNGGQQPSGPDWHTPPPWYPTAFK
ncbi:Imm1 family immunity protein [Actinosynnema sp. CS-041913]|uniref:Imm1 family immunity protein n=1 Tax=Actinosynnema sp. CS-041913 TaxID=3239917 RepID=UPI003D8D65F4